jgi:hypothetical protein
MKAWVKSLSDVDDEGLPKTMVRANWDRRELSLVVTPEWQGGVPAYAWELKVFEYDEAAGSWSKFRCMSTIYYKQLKKRGK